MTSFAPLKLRHRSPPPRALRGHPWAYAGELETLPVAAQAGQGMELLDARGRSLGMGLVNPQSKIVWRRYSREPGVLWDRSYLAKALDRAAARRGGLDSHQRLVWSEADDLPGLVVDRFEDLLVVQALTLGVELALPILLELLEERHRPREILLRNDAPSRRHEGLEAEVRTRSGATLSPGWQTIDGIDYWLDLAQAQKTGFYLDQRDEHRAVARWAPGRRVLDMFCNQGAFALQAAKAGASEVIGVDISAPAIAAAQGNAARAGLEIDFVTANAFDWMTAKAKTERFDLIVLDPPSFAPNKRAVEGALRGYKQLHLRALQMLAPGGVLATYCCSQNVSSQVFFDNLASAASDAHRAVRLERITGQPADHPVRLDFPESAYLKGAIVIVE
jgi:23S rRNA (cytosine1962-C5)-methyltransferase